LAAHTSRVSATDMPHEIANESTEQTDQWVDRCNVARCQIVQILQNLLGQVAARPTLYR